MPGFSVRGWKARDGIDEIEEEVEDRMLGKEIPVRVKQMRFEVATVLSVEFTALDGPSLPAYDPGAHIDVIMGEGLRRSYSLMRPYAEGQGYAVAVHRSSHSRGGSRYVHEAMRVGDRLSITTPSNNFPLNTAAGKSVFIAGGIGITPILCMVTHLSAIGRPWELHYAARSRQAAAFLAEITAIRDNETVHFHFDDETGGRLIDLPRIFSASPEADFYCCGPEPMLAAYEAASRAVPRAQVHVEYFSATEEAARDGGFEIVLNRSGKSFQVPQGKTILDVLIENKINVPFSCSDGVCGTCETRVLEGRPEHRDSFLSDEERAGGKMIMVCCSGSRTERLVLDL
jgi:ferredoxin-NADP reductase